MIPNYPIIHKTGPKGPTGPQAKTLLKKIPEDISLISRKMDAGFLDTKEHIARELNVTKSELSRVDRDLRLMQEQLAMLLTVARLYCKDKGYFPLVEKITELLLTSEED